MPRVSVPSSSMQPQVSNAHCPLRGHSLNEHMCDTGHVCVCAQERTHTPMMTACLYLVAKLLFSDRYATDASTKTVQAPHACA